MPTSPFGLAYGLGAGMAIAPQQMFNRQQQANQLAMQGLQQQLMQHQVAQQQAEDQALSTPVAPQMDQTTPQQALQNVVGAAPQMSGGPAQAGSGNLPGIPEGGVPLGPGRLPTGPTPTLAQAVAPHQHVYVTPYEKMAYELGQRANALQNKGFGISAMQLEQQAMHYSQLHQQAARGIAVQGIMNGSKQQAINALNSIGYPAQDVGKFSTPDGDMYYIKSPDGSDTIMNRQDLGAVAADPTQISNIMEKQDQYRNLYGWRIGAAEAAAQSREKIAQIQAQQKELDRQNKIALANIKNSNNRQGATPAKIQIVMARKANIMKNNPGLSDAEAEAQAWNLQDKGVNAKDIPLAVARERLNRIEKTLNGPPQPSDPQYADWKQAHDIVINSMRPPSKRAQPTPTQPQGQPKQNYEGEISPTGKWKFSGGKWVPNQ